METLTFDLREVGEQMRHALSCTSWKQTYGETEQKAGLWWVKDEGTYLMSNGISDDRPAPAYAEGLGPDAEWDLVQEICGGDDFAEFLDMTDIPSPLFALTGEYSGTLTITFDESTLIIEIHTSADQKASA